MVSLTTVRCTKADYIVSVLYLVSINCLLSFKKLRINILYSILKQTGSQCRRIKVGVMWSNLGVRRTNQAAQFCVRCVLAIGPNMCCRSIEEQTTAVVFATHNKSYNS